MIDSCDKIMDNKAHSQFVTALTKQLRYLKTNGFPGLCKNFGELSQHNQFMKWDENEEIILLENILKTEELTLQLPFAGTNLTIQLYFNIIEPWVPPDMLFSDFKFNKYVIEKEDLQDFIPCLDSWNYLDEDLLGQLLFEVHYLYKTYQLRCLEDEGGLQFEYLSLMEAIIVKEDDIEISLTGGTSWLAAFLVRLPLNMKDVPPALIDANPGPPMCLLHISIRKNTAMFIPRLQLSPQVESLIGGADTLGLPVVPADTSFTEYICNIISLLDDRIRNTVLSFEIRKQVVAQFLCCMGPAMMEYDAEKFSRISLFLDWQDFNVLLVVDLPQHFPKTCASLTFRSVYHMNCEEPFSQTFNNIKVSPQSTPDEIVETIKTAIKVKLPIFKKDSVASSIKSG